MLVGVAAGLVLELVARPAGAGAGRVAPLQHEAVDDAVEDHAVVKPLAGEEDEVVDGLRGVLGEELDVDLPHAGVDLGGVMLGRVDGHLRRFLVLLLCHGGSLLGLRLGVALRARHRGEAEGQGGGQCGG